jgi:hypothetical protein
MLGNGVMMGHDGSLLLYVLGAVSYLLIVGGSSALMGVHDQFYPWASGS